MKNFLVVSLLIGSFGFGAALVSPYISKFESIKSEFFASDEYSANEKVWIWEQTINIVSHDLGNLDFGGAPKED